MMKRLALLVAIGLMAGASHAAGPAAIRASIDNVATSTVTASTKDFDAVYGYINRIDLDLPTAGTTCQVAVVVTTNNSFEVARQVMVTGAISNGAHFYPRVATCTTNGTALTDYARIPLVNATLQLQVWSATLTNKTVHATVIIDEP